MYNTLNVMGYDVLVDNIDTIKIDKDKKQIINTINPHSYVIAKKDLYFKEALQTSDILIPDGSGIVIAVKYIHSKTIKKIAGSDIHMYLLSELEKIGGKVFYMGASQETLKKIHIRINKEYPSVKVASYSPPFKSKFTQNENAKIVANINAFKPDILFIGMTAPKQEKWLQQHKNQLDFKIASSIGAVFDFYAGTVKRPSQFWINMHLEWLPRFLKEPRRLWKRNFISTPIFLKDMLMH
jgi:N-acetylglucosaminyldiphosphoundecaprenol N-acetyl-beta-D-mannosaminyltransferase